MVGNSEVFGVTVFCVRWGIDGSPITMEGGLKLIPIGFVIHTVDAVITWVGVAIISKLGRNGVDGD